MKNSLHESRKKTLRLFDNKFDPSFVFFGFIIGGVLCLGGYLVAHQVSVERLRSVEIQQASELANLQSHSVAQTELERAQASIAALRTQGIDVSSAEHYIEELKANFSQRKYLKVSELSAQVVSESARLRDEDETLIASYSASLINVQIKYQKYAAQGVKVSTLSADLASASGELTDKHYDRVATVVGSLNKLLDTLFTIKVEADKKAAAAAVSANSAAPVPAQSNGGVTYERKVVNTAIGPFTADILTVDMNRVKVKTFTANENDCANDCPVKPLAAYVGENGGIAGINGTYFCPPDYSQCAGVKNSFNTLVFDYKSKHYLNSAQNQYSVNPLIAFYPDGAHFYTQALGYGRDTSANGVISNHPTLVHNGGVATQVNLDAKSSGKGLRGGIGFNGKTLWAVVTRNATVSESGYVFTALGAQYAMNLDGGGSTALYFGGYKVGPGRQLPNAVVFTN